MFRRRHDRDEPSAHENPNEQGAWADYETTDETSPAEGVEPEQEAEFELVEVDLSPDPASVEPMTAPSGAGQEAAGPYDVDDLDDPRAGRLDLGGMLVAGTEGMELRLEVDEQSGAVMAATAVLGDSALQIQPFAAPRGRGLWDDVREEIARSIRDEGGRADPVEGGFGTELAAEVTVPGPDGTPIRQRVRFVGVDGPRWFLRGVFSGRAGADPGAAAPLVDVFRQVVVVRGGDPMAPREPIPLRLPDQGAAEAAPAGPEGQRGADDLHPFQRGPEITEIR